MMVLQDAVVRPLHYVSGMQGDCERNITPPDQFYLQILELWRYRVLVVRFDKTKIRISLQDAKVIFDFLRAFIECINQCTTREATASAVLTWEAVGPQIDDEVAPGTVVLDEGYLLIRLEDIHPQVAYGHA